MLRKLLNIVLIVSLLGNILLGGLLVFTKIAEKEASKQVKAQQINENALIFTKLFVQKVLQSQEEIGFEDRLQLENAVRGLNDQVILSQWQKFTKAQSNESAQEEAGALFILLLNKISY